MALAHLEPAEGADHARVEIHLRRAAEAAEGPALEDGAGPWDVLLPGLERRDLEVAIRRVCDLGNAPLARRLCAAERRRSLHLPVSTAPAPFTAAVAAEHRHRFEARYLRGVVGDGEFAAWASLRDAELAAEWPLRAPRVGEARLEFRVFEDWMVGFLVLPSNDVRMHRWSVGRVAVGRAVAELRGWLKSADDPRRLLRASAALHDLVWAPFEADLRDVGRVLVAPDGPLCGLPFATLWRDRFVAERHDVAVVRPAPPPAFAEPSPVAPRVALVVGEATARDLELGTLCGEQGWFLGIDTRMGEDLSPERLLETLGGARVVQLVGEIDAGPMLALADGQPALPVERVACALGAGGAVCVVLCGPVEGANGRAAIGGLLAGARGGVLARHVALDDDGGMLLRFLAGAAAATGPWPLVEALGEARRAAISADLSPATWGAYELYLADGV